MARPPGVLKAVMRHWWLRPDLRNSLTNVHASRSQKGKAQGSNHE
jgi:hypothetical protein